MLQILCDMVDHTYHIGEPVIFAVAKSSMHGMVNGMKQFGESKALQQCFYKDIHYFMLFVMSPLFYDIF